MESIIEFVWTLARIIAACGLVSLIVWLFSK